MNLLRFDWIKVNLHCGNVSKLSLSRYAYYTSAFNVFRTFEIQKSCGLTSVRLEQGKTRF